MVISHVTIIADSAMCFNAILGAILGVMGQLFYSILFNFILVNTQNKFHITAHPCIILYICTVFKKRQNNR